MALSYAELIEVVDKDDWLTTLLELATLAGFPATSWQPGSVPRTLLEIEAEALATIGATVRQVALGGMIDEAEGDWLTLLCRSVFQVERLAAVRARGTAVLTCSPLAGPYTIAVGQITATNAAGKRFRNTIGGTLPSNGTLGLTFEAEEPGAAYNIANGTLTIMLTPLAGVTISNPLISGSTTWLTTTGADIETDDQLRARCKAKWATIGTGATSDTFRFWALTAAAEVKRVKVLEHSDEGTSADGHVTLYLAGDSGPVSSGDPEDAVETVEAYIAERRPLCVTPHILSATGHPITITAEVFVVAAQLGAAQAVLEDHLQELVRSIEIGGTVYRAAIIEQLMRPEGAVNAALAAPVADVVLASNEVATFSFAIDVDIILTAV